MSIPEAVQRLKSHDVVGIPTETVYGLAARIDSELALKKIFQIKNRPFFDPLIVHVASVEDAKPLVKEWDELTDKLAKKFWPGPLTLVKVKTSKVSDLISSGLGTVGIRCPDHAMTLELIKQLGIPLAAPSANKFGKTSPTTAEHVRTEFKNDNVYVLDGGPCRVGLESTVLKLDRIDGKYDVQLLRPGGISADEIEAFLESTGLPHQFHRIQSSAHSPGAMKHHYMPEIPLVYVSEGQAQWAQNLEKHFAQLPDIWEGVALKKPKSFTQWKELVLSESPTEAARELYASLRLASQEKVDFIVFFEKSFHKGTSWEAIQDRLKKAASVKI